MIRFKNILLTLLLTLGSKALAQSIVPQYNLSEFEFNSIFGVKNNDEKEVYCLLGNGFFRAPRSENIDQLISNWINQHPNAKVVPVSISESKDEEVSFVYCWIISPTDTLNIHLVEKGAISGSTMIRAKTSTMLDSNLVVDEDFYNFFLDRIKDVESYAFKKKQGIWNSFIEENR